MNELKLINDECTFINLFGACGDYDDEATPELLTKLGMEFTTEPKFNPISEREVKLTCYGEGAVLFNNGFARFIRIVIINDKKYLNLSDDDRHEILDGRDEDIPVNLATSQAAMKQSALITDGYYSEDIIRNDNGTVFEYYVDSYIPIEFFDPIQTQAQMKAFLSKCDFSTPEAIQAAFDYALTV